MTPPDARVLIVATLIIAGVPVAVHEYRIHAHHTQRSHAESQDAHGDWGATSASGSGHGDRSERSGTPDERPAR